MDEEIINKIKVQKEYCIKNKIPSFAPGEGFAPNNGICFSCNRQIYNQISLEKAGKELITGCPYCNRSYCD